VYPADATDKRVKWTSSNDAVAAVDANGMVTGKSDGKARITVSTLEGGKTAICDVAVESVADPVSGITLNKKTLNINKDGVEKLTYTVSPANATVKDVKWTSSNPDIAAVDQDGKVSGVGDGSAVITVSAENGGFTDTCAVTVTVPVSGVSLEHNKIVIKGGSVTLDYTVIPVNATNKAVTWKSSNNTVATVDASGTVSAKAGGQATITVTTVDGGKTDTCAFTVAVPVSGVSLNPTTLTLVPNGTAVLNADVSPADATNKALTWSSSNNAVAAVSTSGTVTAKSGGSAVITVRTADGGKTASCVVTVAVPVSGVSLNQTALNLVKGSAATLSADVSPTDATNKAVTWASSSDTVATVDASGKVTANSVGSAVITATTADGGYMASCAVTVAIPVNGVSLNPPTLILVNGSTATLSADVSPADATNKAVTWTSSSPAVATVDASGKVTANSVGSAVITVTTADGGYMASCAVTVAVAYAVFNVSGKDGWDSALQSISTSASGGSAGNPNVFIINITGSFGVAGISGNSINGNYKEVRLTGSGTMSLLSASSLIRTAANQTFIIDGPTLQGTSGNNASLVYIAGGAVEFHSGYIKNNNNGNSYGGGGVYVAGGNFTMTGGEISDNNAFVDGGGVHVAGGNFTMTGGEISGNSALFGGGVWVDDGGNFTMNNGVISGNNAGDVGGGVYVYSGNFTMNNGTIYGDDANPAALRNTAAYYGAAGFISPDISIGDTIHKYP
jgi:uncharacterized protein YjdB